MNTNHTYTDFTNPAVYVGTYAKYNSGSIAGKWVDLYTFCDYDEFIAYCHELHADEVDPEFMIQDYDNFPNCWYSESGVDEETFDKIINYASADNKDVIDAFISCFDVAYLDSLDERYCGCWNSEIDFAQSIIEECYTLPDFAMNYFDYEKFARDLFLCDYSYHNGYVFHNF